MLADCQEHSIDYPPVLSLVQHNKPVMVVIPAIIGHVPTLGVHLLVSSIQDEDVK